MTAIELEQYGQNLTPKEIVGVQLSVARDELRDFLSGPVATEAEFELATSEYLTAFNEYYFGDANQVASACGVIVHREASFILEEPFDHSDSIQRTVNRHMLGELSTDQPTLSRACGFTILDLINQYGGLEVKTS